MCAVRCEQGKGASRQALLKYMMKNFSLGQDEKAVNVHLKLALKTGLEKGLLLQTTGKGAMGSVKLNKEALKPAKPAAKAATAKKPKAATAVKKPKATTAKAAATKKTLKPKKVSLGTAKAKKPSLTKKATSKVVAKPKVAPKKTAAAKPKATKAKLVKPKVTKAAAGKGKKPASKKWTVLDIGQTSVNLHAVLIYWFSHRFSSS